MSCKTLIVFFLLVLCASNTFSQEAPPPAIAGYVTAVKSPTVFDVNGTHILCDGKTQLSSSIDGKRHPTSVGETAYIGEPLDIYGSANKKTHTILATEVIALSAAASSTERYCHHR